MQVLLGRQALGPGGRPCISYTLVSAGANHPCVLIDALDLCRSNRSVSGGGTILLPGATIDRNAVVGAGAVLSRGVPASTVVARNPPRVIREIEVQ